MRSVRIILVTAVAALSGLALEVPAQASTSIGDRLEVNHVLNPDYSIDSPNGAYHLKMQTDGNLVEYGPGGPIWATYTPNPGTSGNGAYLKNQDDGNIVIYGPGWTWATGTNGKGTASLVIQDDGNVVAYGSSGPTWSTYTNNGANKLKATGAVAYARRQLGKPYVSGGTGPNAFDCSGLTQQAYASVGVGLNRTSQQQWNQGTSVNRADLQPGDLTFYNTSAGTLAHVGIYIGNGQIIDALNSRTGVRVDATDYPGTYVGARRVA